MLIFSLRGRDPLEARLRMGRPKLGLMTNLKYLKDLKDLGTPFLNLHVESEVVERKDTRIIYGYSGMLGVRCFFRW